MAAVGLARDRKGARLTMIGQQMGFDDLDPREATIEAAFNAYHAAHPNVCDELIRMSREAKAAGRRRIGIGMLFEVLRWNAIIAGLPDPHEAYKLNNNYRSRYVRLIEERAPDLIGFFEKRALKAA